MVNEQKLIEIISTGLVGFKSMLIYMLKEKDQKTTFIPPTKEEITRAYQNDPVINKHVQWMASIIMEEEG